MADVTTYKLAISLLKQAGTKAAIQSKHDGPFIIVQKTDLISELQARRERYFALGNDADMQFTDYDGNVEAATFEDGILHIHAGSF